MNIATKIGIAGIRVIYYPGISCLVVIFKQHIFIVSFHAGLPAGFQSAILTKWVSIINF